MLYIYPALLFGNFEENPAKNNFNSQKLDETESDASMSSHEGELPKLYPL